MLLEHDSCQSAAFESAACELGVFILKDKDKYASAGVLLQEGYGCVFPSTLL